MAYTTKYFLNLENVLFAILDIHKKIIWSSDA
jgi:hypothetical protein